MEASADIGSRTRSLSSNSQTERPFVTVVMPVYNEERFIHQALESVLQQDYPAEKMEIMIADGMSSDRTRAIIEEFQQSHQNVKLVLNPKRIVSTGLNRAIQAAKGEIIVRLDGHCDYPKDYVRRVIELRQQLGADNVGGVLVPVGVSYVQQAIAKAYYSPGGFGGQALKPSREFQDVREVDAVHGGCWKRSRLIEVGGFDEQMVRNQDDELSFRLRKNSGKIFQSPSLRVKYHVRDNFKKLFRQFVQYGYWKVHVVSKHPHQASARHVIPGLFVLALATLSILSPLHEAALMGFFLLTITYLSALSVTSLIQTRREIRLWPAVVIALVLMHIGYGSGFIAGCFRRMFNLSHRSCLFAEPTR